MVVLDAFLDWCQKNKAARTDDWYRDYLESFARSISPGLPVADLWPFRVQKWVDGGAGWTTGRRGAIIAAQRAFHRAARMELIPASPVRGMEKPRAGRREHVITAEQFALIGDVVAVQQIGDALQAEDHAELYDEKPLVIQAGVGGSLCFRFGFGSGFSPLEKAKKFRPAEAWRAAGMRFFLDSLETKAILPSDSLLHGAASTARFLTDEA